jgi:hypothetical protein
MKLRDILTEELNDIDDIIDFETYEYIKKLISKGAQSPDYQWANALDLIHRAFKVTNTPIPDVHSDAWKQYEQLITFAVDQLKKATAKGIRDDSWLMTTKDTKFRQW